MKIEDESAGWPSADPRLLHVLFHYLPLLDCLLGTLGYIGVLEVEQDALLLQLLLVTPHDLAQDRVVRVNRQALLVDEPEHVVLVHRLPRVEAPQNQGSQQSEDEAKTSRDDQTGELESSLLAGTLGEGRGAVSPAGSEDAVEDASEGGEDNAFERVGLEQWRGDELVDDEGEDGGQHAHQEGGEGVDDDRGRRAQEDSGLDSRKSTMSSVLMNFSR